MVLIRYTLKPILQALVIYIGLCALSTFSAHAQNAIRIDDVAGESNFIRASDASTTPIIYGGIAGASTICDGQSLGANDYCNTCTTSIQACNQLRIHKNQTLTITFTVVGDISGFIRLLYSNGSTTLQDVSGFTRSTNESIGKNRTESVSTTWNKLCEYFGSGDSACDTTGLSGKLYVCVSSDSDCQASEYTAIDVKLFKPENANGIDTIECDLPTDPQDGICAFEAFPGDEKITVIEIDEEGDFPNANDVPFKYMRVFFSTVDFNDVTYVSSFADLDVNSDSSVSPDQVQGLENDVFYFFKSAMVDNAFNIAYLTSDAQITAECGAAINANDTDDVACIFIAKPSKVYGLLTEDFNCFITTAAYGSSFAPKVIDFRAFRNKFLVPSELGRKIIFFYYDVGPKAARWLGENDWAKPMVRAALLPAWLFVETANFLGLIAATTLFTSIFILLICGFFVLRSSKRRIEV